MIRKIVNIAIAILMSLGIHGQILQNVDSKTFSDYVNGGKGIVLDVRTLPEYSRGHIKGSTLISTSDPKVIEKLNLLQKDKPVYVYCLTGSRSRSVAKYLNQNGFSEVYNLNRGIMEWQQNGYSIVQSDIPISTNTKTYNNTEFNQLISSQELVLIDFYASWCAPCKKMSPIIDKLQDDYAGKAIIGKIDVEANNALKNLYSVQSIPGLLLFKSGKEVWRHTGVISYEDLSSILKQHF